MSIIYDALKKTQENRDTYHQRASTKSQEVVIPRSNRVKAILLVMFGVLVVAFFAYERFTGTDFESQYHKAAISKKLATLAQEKKSLQVTGTFLSDKVKLAMINQQMYHVGDMVGDVKIVAIDGDNVEFRNEQGEFGIKVAA